MKEIMEFRPRKVRNTFIAMPDGCVTFFLFDADGRELQLTGGPEMARVVTEMFRNAFPSIGGALH